MTEGPSSPNESRTQRAVQRSRRAVAVASAVAAGVLLPVRDRIGRTRPRTRVGVLAAVVVVVWAAATILDALVAVGEVRSDFREIANEVSAVGIEQLLEPETFFRLSAASAELEASVSRLDTPLLFLRPVGWVPLLGGRVRAAQNTVAAGREAAFASTRILHVYGEGVRERSATGPDGLAGALAGGREQLVEADAALARAQPLLAKPQMLDAQERALADAGISVLRTFALMGLETPQAVDDAFEIVQNVSALQGLLETPLDALADAQSVRQRLVVVRSNVNGLQASIAAIAEADASRRDALAVASEALSAAASLAEAAGSILDITDALKEGAFSPEFGAAVGPKLLLAQERIADAKSRLAELEHRFRSSEEDEAPGSGVFASLDSGLDRAEGIVRALHTFLGFDGPRTYLLILQNQNEIRATGGFIGATAQLRLENGVLGAIVYDDSTRLDPTPLINNPTAPEPLYWYLWMGRLLFRDANWNPDFPTSARTIIDLYERARGVRADGVFAATKLLGLDLVDLFGDITVPGVEGPLTREAAFQYMEDLAPYQCRPEQVSTRGKRCFDEDLLPAVIDRLQAGIDGRELNGLLGVVQRQLDEKSMLLYVADSDAEAVIHDLGWSGVMPSPAQDMLMVVDSSLPGHTTAAITRIWDYRVSVDPRGSNKAWLLLQYVNNRAVRDPDCRQAAEGGGGCYWNYARVYLSPSAEQVQAPPVPLHEGSEKLIWGHRDPDSLQISTHASGALSGLVEVGAYLTVHPGTTLTLPISYDLNRRVVRTTGERRYEYRLLLVKQPGVDRDQVRVEVDLPKGAVVAGRSPDSMQVDGNRVYWQGLLTQDTPITVVFELPGD